MKILKNYLSISIKGERGSITLFVVVVCMFIVGMLVYFMMSIENKKQIQSKEIQQIIQNYQQDEEEMQEIYDKILN